MTKERLLYLSELVDRVNKEVNATVSLEYSRYSSLHVTIFYCGRETASRMFDEHEGIENRYPDLTFGDTHLEKAEKFLRVLLASAEHYPPMRREAA